MEMRLAFLPGGLLLTKVGSDYVVTVDETEILPLNKRGYSPQEISLRSAKYGRKISRNEAN